MFLERTIRKSISVVGIGLHTGEPAEIILRPAAAGSGVSFVRAGTDDVLPVRAHLVRATQMATTLGTSGFQISTVEHLLAALGAFRIDNLRIELRGREMPILDGSAKGFVDALNEVGVVEQDAPRRYLAVTSPVFIGDPEKHAYVVPYSGLRVTCTIDFRHPEIGRQYLDLDVNETSFAREIASARTFGFLSEVEALRARGLALGGSLDNAVVLDEKSVMNPGGLRFPDEFVRHKVLDAVGDLMTLGRPFLGRLVLYRAGHDLMNRLVRELVDKPERLREVELGGGYRQRTDESMVGTETPSEWITPQSGTSTTPLGSDESSLASDWASGG